MAWAPNLGRTYHLIASAGKDHIVRIFRLVYQPQIGKLECREVAVLSEHNAEVWRVEWNLSGTVLASSGDDGAVRLWRADAAGTWALTNVVAGDA